jgi:hypothetical protein
MLVRDKVVKLTTAMRMFMRLGGACAATASIHSLPPRGARGDRGETAEIDAEIQFTHFSVKSI